MKIQHFTATTQNPEDYIIPNPEFYLPEYIPYTDTLFIDLKHGIAHINDWKGTSTEMYDESLRFFSTAPSLAKIIRETLG